VLTKAIVKATIGSMDDDNDRLAAGIFTFVFSDYFAHLIGGTFEMASCFALAELVHVSADKDDDEYEQTLTQTSETYNRIVRSEAIEAIGKSWELSLTMLKFAKRSLPVEMLGSLCVLCNSMS
jgi:hypothetical protein